MTVDPEFAVKRLGPAQVDSPALKTAAAAERTFVDDDVRLLIDDRAGPDGSLGGGSLELAGPRRRLFFDPSRTRAAIVTCGGLCPGLNDVVRGLVMVLYHRYGVRYIHGFRYGYRGCTAEYRHESMLLDPELVSDIHEQGGTMLGSSRGPQQPADIARNLDEMGINVLFAIGGDGTIRGALEISQELARRKLAVSVVGIPKTIDNDVAFVDQTFGFATAYAKAVEVIYGAHNESRGAPNGIGLVKLQGRHSGFVACHATLATSHVNFTLIPEVPLALDGPDGLLSALQRRLERRQHAVIVAAEGAGQELMADGQPERDASGNVKLKDIGQLLAKRIEQHFQSAGTDISLKYFDPSYLLRSVPATPADSVYCWRLAENAVHAAMCGRTEMIVAQWHGRLVHVPMPLAIQSRKQVDPQGELWLSVLESTGQPPRWG